MTVFAADIKFVCIRIYSAIYDVFWLSRLIYFLNNNRNTLFFTEIIQPFEEICIFAQQKNITVLWFLQ
jgi:hypothetical protein